MTITAIAMVRDEDDIIEAAVDQLWDQGVDRFLIADNGSVDGSLDFLDGSDNATIIDDPEPGYYQDRKMTGLARRAFDEGAEWVLPFDADEWWYSPDGRTIAEVLHGTDSDVVAAVEFKHWPTPWDEPGLDPINRITWREAEPHRLHKIAFRATPTAAVHMGNHGVNLDGNYNPDRPDPATPLLELRHFPYRSFSQFVRKVRNGREAYEAARLHPMFGTHWREMGAMSDDELARLWADCTAGEAFAHRWMGHGDLTRDPAP